MVSLIIPVLQEEARLQACLDVLAHQAREVGAEILVVDGGSEDRTREVARSNEIVRLLVSAAGRGTQMNRGVRAARGSLLVFVAADTLLPPGALRLLDEIDRRGDPPAGGFRQRFDSTRPFLRLVSRLHNLRASITGVFYGDQAPFVRRDLFLETGGFREDLSMEDVEFGTRLRRRVRTRRLALTVETSSRRFDRHGDLRTVAEAARLLSWWTFFRRIRPSPVFFGPAERRGPRPDLPGGSPAQPPGAGSPAASASPAGRPRGVHRSQ